MTDPKSGSKAILAATAIISLSLGIPIGILIGHYEASTDSPETRGRVFLPKQGDDSGSESGRF